MSTNYITKDKINIEFSKSIDKLDKKLKLIDIALVNGTLPLEKNTYHLITHAFQPENNWDKILYSHIFKAVQRNELMSAGSAYMTALFSVILFKRFLTDRNYILGNESQIYADIAKAKEQMIFELRKNSNPLREDDVDSILSTYLGNEKMEDLLREAIGLAGMEGNISFESTTQEGYSVELRYGYNFKAQTYKNFLGKLGNWESSDVKVFCVDGIIENISEIEKLLIRSSNTKIPLIIIAQGFSEEIYATLKVNNDKRKFTIIPVKLEQSLENINILNDISSCVGGTVFSVLQGQQMVYVNYDELPMVDFVKITESDILFKQNNTRAAVSAQIQRLLEKRAEQSTEQTFDIVKLLDNRIKNLLAHSVIVRLPNISNLEIDTLKVKFDVALRTIKSISGHGYVKKSDLNKIDLTHVQKEYRELWYAYLNLLSNDKDIPEQIPLLSIVTSSCQTINALFGLLLSRGGIIIDDEDEE